MMKCCPWIAFPRGSRRWRQSRRENEVPDLLSQGFGNKEIAQTLSISLDTVRYHLKQIYDKLHVRSRTEAVLKFLK